jgi:Glu-tRNA(Gln) amidotransferase subunit E-like FAD-binding protein
MFDESLMSAPIPGMSLTTEPGNRPWENPPQLNTLEDAIEFYADRILDPAKAEAVLDPLVQDISVESVVDYLTTSSVMNGLHSLDISFLVTPVLSEMIKYVADANGVEYKESYTNVQKAGLPKHEVRKIVKEAAEKAALDFGKMGMGGDKEPAMESPMMESAMPRGLMARRPVEGEV